MDDTNFDRRTADAQIGYLTGRIEGIEERLEQHMDAQTKIGAQLSRIEEQLSMYRHLTFFIRSLALITAAVVAFKWGVVRDIWNSFIHGGVT